MFENAAEKYFKSICEDYNEELERTGKRHYWVGFDIKNGYITGAEFGYNKAKEEMQAQIEKLIDFVLSKTDCCDVCPITDTCINSEGTCPYASILVKGEKEVTREWLIQFISRR